MTKRIVFNMRELSGSMGDFGTLFPLAVGYIAVCGLDPAGLLIMMGIANIATGLIYGLPLPIEPMKIIAVAAIAQRWTPEMVYASAFTMGITWLIIGGTGLINIISVKIPIIVVRGIQIALGFLLAREALTMISSWYVLGLASLAVIYILKDNRYFPAGVALMAVGVIIMAVSGQLPEFNGLSLHLPKTTFFGAWQMWDSLLLGGFAQIPMTATNAVIATAALIKTYWPESRVTEKQLAVNMGIMNTIFPFLGGMPLCHGAGGLAGQYSFGARTGGTNIIEGSIEILLGLFLASSIALIFAKFPTAIIGAMMLFVGLELIKFTRQLSGRMDAVVVTATVVTSLLFNVAAGFTVGLCIYYLLKAIIHKKEGKYDANQRKKQATGQSEKSN